MRPEEYLSRLKIIEDDFIAKKLQLNNLYVRSSNKFSVGDVVTDHLGSILVQELFFGFPLESKVPCAVYRGLVLNNNGSIKKNAPRRTVWQTDLIESNVPHMINK